MIPHYVTDGLATPTGGESTDLKAYKMPEMGELRIEKHLIVLMLTMS